MESLKSYIPVTERSRSGSIAKLVPSAPLRERMLLKLNSTIINQMRLPDITGNQSAHW